MNEPKHKIQPKKHIITIAGRPASGKSTTAKGVAVALGFEHFSSGDLFRQLGRERGLDVLQTNLRGEKNAEVDYLVDQKLREIGEQEDKKVIDSRTAWHWIPSSFKVFLDLDFDTAAQRILANMDEGRIASENIPGDPKRYAEILQARLESESRRYKLLYNINPYDIANYDLVVDTAAYGVERVVSEIVQKFQSWIHE